MKNKKRLIISLILSFCLLVSGMVFSCLYAGESFVKPATGETYADVYASKTRINSDIEGIYAISDEGFAEDVRLIVEVLLEKDEIVAEIGEKAYNSLGTIKGVYVFKFEGQEPSEYSVYFARSILNDEEVLNQLIGDTHKELKVEDEEILVFSSELGVLVITEKGDELELYLWILIFALLLLLIILLVFIIYYKKITDKENNSSSK